MGVVFNVELRQGEAHVGGRAGVREDVARLANLHGVPGCGVHKFTVLDERGFVALGLFLGHVGTIFNKETFDFYNAVHALGRDGEGVVGLVEEAAREALFAPLHVVVDDRVAREVVAVLDDDTSVFKSLFGLHLNGEGLSEGRLVAREGGTIGCYDITIAVGLLNGAVVAVDIDHHVDNIAAVGNHCVVGARITACIGVIPVHLEAHAIETFRHIGGDGKCGRVEQIGAFGKRVAQAVLALVVGVGHEVALGGQCAVVVDGDVKLAVVVLVEIDVAVHPRARIPERSRHVFAWLEQEYLARHVAVRTFGVGGRRDGLLARAGRCDGHGIGPAVVAGVVSVLVEVGGIEFVGEAHLRIVVDFDIVDVAHLVGGVGVRRFAVGDDDEAVDVDASVTLDGEHDVLPSVGGNIAHGHGPELLRHGTLASAVAAFSQSDHHHAARIGTVDHEVEIFGGGRQFKGFVEFDQRTESITAEARTLNGENFAGGVGSRAELFVHLIEVVVDDGHVARQFACAER